MNIDDLGRRAGRDLQHASNRLAPSLASAPDLLDLSRRRRAQRRALVLAVVLVPLVGGVAFAASGPDDHRETRVATEGVSTVPDDSAEPTGTEPTNPTSTVASCSPGTAAGTVPGDGTNCAPPPVPTPTTVTLPPDDNPTMTTTTTTPGPGDDGLGRVSGHVLAGPQCPVEGPGQSCDDVGIVATITFALMRDDADFLYERTVTSESDGSYAVDLAPGRFSVTVTSDGAMSCDPATVRVVEGEAVTLDLSCDTGIR